MRRSKFTSSQIATCLTQAEAGVPLGELCRKYGISLQRAVPLALEHPLRGLGPQARRRDRLHLARSSVENGHIESFDDWPRDECLNTSWFTDLEDARHTIEAWMLDDNHVRPHSRLGKPPPATYVAGGSC